MKLLFILIFLFSCSNKEDASFIEQGSPTEIRQYLKGNVEGDIDLFVAFFWPSEIREDESEIVRDLIGDSLQISKKKNTYFEKKRPLQCDYKQASCDCLLQDLCDEGEVANPRNLSYCQDTAEKLDEIEFEIIEIAMLIESLQNRLNQFQEPGEWLSTHLDFPDSLYTPYLDLEGHEFSIPILGDEKISYSTKMGDVFNFNYKDPTISLELKEKTINGKEVQYSGNIIKAKIDILNKKHVYQFTGELTKEVKGKLRRGILYFELPKPEPECTD